jgi:hypothetical protein
MPVIRPDIPPELLEKWQRIINLASRMADVPAGLIMKTDAPDHAVLLRSEGYANPYSVGDRFTLGPKLYCQEVIVRADELIVERLRPKIIIPTHYLNESTTYTLSTLAPADEWVKAQKSYRMLDNASLSLAADDVADMDREFLYFGAHVQTS